MIGPRCRIFRAVVDNNHPRQAAFDRSASGRALNDLGLKAPQRDSKRFANAPSSI